MLNWPSSVWKSGRRSSASTSALRIAGSPSVVDEVELDLQAGHRPVGVEAEVVEHAREDVEAARTFCR